MKDFNAHQQGQEVARDKLPVRGVTQHPGFPRTPQWGQV